jgi:hypothetical protein
LKDWKPHAKPLTQADHSSLSAEEILVLACVDGRTSVSEIPYSSGMPPDVVREIVERLESRGALLRESPAPRPVEPGGTPGTPAPPPPPAEEPDVGWQDAPPPAEEPDVGWQDAPPPPAEEPDVGWQDAPQSPAEEPDVGWQDAPQSPAEEPDVGWQDAPPLPDDPSTSPEEPAHPEPSDPGAVAEDATLEQQSATLRQLYATRLAQLTRDERLARVGGAIDPELSAFCFDPEPVVIHRIFENARAGLVQARLVAAHHRTSRGLEVLTKHQSMLHDGQVQRLLLRNAMLPQSLFTRILQPKRLPEIYRTMLSRDVPERTRVWTRNLLRQKWPVAQPEERVELVWQTEGRVLPILIGCHLDSKSTLLLCKRPIVSVIFVRNFATWPATPPPLLAHLLKQPLVKRMPQLRNMLLRHPNVPSEAKRKG